jgi:diguanylate cyclase (GGDEF)-like protein
MTDTRPRSRGRAPDAPRQPELAPTAPGRPVDSARLSRHLAALDRPHADTGDTTVARRLGLFGYTAASIAVGLALLAWTTVVIPVGADIDPRLVGAPLPGPLGGAVLWILFGFLGSLRVLRAPGGAGYLTFHLPFVAAALVLGGPTAGAWVGFVSTLERRELEQLPWYGLLANHAVFVIAAVAGGLVAQQVGELVHGVGSAGLETALVAVSGTLVLSIISTAMAAVTVMIRDEVSVPALVDILKGQFGRLSALEVALAWTMVIVYTQIGWWAPALVGVIALLAWDNHPMPSPDALTGLLSADGFTRRLDAGVGRLRHGLVPGATLMAIDLDGFKAVNDRYGHAVGDEVLAVVGARLAAQARRPMDMAGRAGGDEFAMFLPGLADPTVAMRRANEVAQALEAPIATSVGHVVVGASVGVVVLSAWGGVPATGTIQRHADAAMFLAKRSGGGSHLYDPREAGPFDDNRLGEDR